MSPQNILLYLGLTSALYIHNSSTTRRPSIDLDNKKHLFKAKYRSIVYLKTHWMKDNNSNSPKTRIIWSIALENCYATIAALLY